MALRATRSERLVTTAEGTANVANVESSINGKSALVIVGASNKTADGWAEVQIKTPGEGIWVPITKLSFLPFNQGAIFPVNLPAPGLPTGVRVVYRDPTAGDTIVTNFIFNEEDD